MRGVTIESLASRGDGRGDSITIPGSALAFLGGVGDVHLTTIVAGAVRGNHFHQRRREALLVMHRSEWELRWDLGEGTAVQEQRFPGKGVELVMIEPGCAHAVVNCGEMEMLVFGMSSAEYDPGETIPRRLC